MPIPSLSFPLFCQRRKTPRFACRRALIVRIKPIHGESRGPKVKHVQDIKRIPREPAPNKYGSVKIAHSQYVSLITTHCSNTKAITSHRSVLVFSGPWWLAGWQKTLLRFAQKTNIALFQISGIIIRGICDYSADATPCRIVQSMGAQHRRTAATPPVGPSNLAAWLSLGRPTPSSAQAKHPPWGSKPRPQG